MHTHNLQVKLLAEACPHKPKRQHAQQCDFRQQSTNTPASAPAVTEDIVAGYKAHIRAAAAAGQVASAQVASDRSASQVSESRRKY